ncbi:uncharacterized protein LACBIDRAFT_326307 [Laccaria bicolor S238N-H82]|uniref:Predicted protein n=1 Tax=Laccaria bicolor (strain S238N-H82 / ATCC MYA-4686) TaxID=486041 RepID=B0D801_LACBS|nr:uncharacterized protein LACBIDRAFT_326307 [Laccaria bicolor S238N-H82]EDR09731.1 predicted protein [Laccaria bicolor S238N-H82]|eukprot:XP_001880080.1 predicted protein [Laccaria bicolor S238N-H82]
MTTADTSHNENEVATPCHLHPMAERPLAMSTACGNNNMAHQQQPFLWILVPFLWILVPFLWILVPFLWILVPFLSIPVHYCGFQNQWGMMKYCMNLPNQPNVGTTNRNPAPTMQTTSSKDAQQCNTETMSPTTMPSHIIDDGSCHAA